MKKHLTYIILCSALLAWGLGSLFYRYAVIQDVQTLEADLLVQNEVYGFNSDRDAIHFGALKPEGSSKRVVDVISKKPAWVTVKMKGNLSDWTDVSNYSFYLDANLLKQVEFQATVPLNATAGNYFAKVTFIFRHPWMRYLEKETERNLSAG